MKLILLLALFLISIPAHAELRAEALGGACGYTKAGNGIWYVEKYPHAFDLTPRCGFIGVSSVSHGDRIAFGWRVGYVTFGRAQVDAFWPAHDSEHGLPVFDGLECNHKTFFGCLARGVGYQTARGISAGYVVEDKIGLVTLGLELGGYLYEGVWRAEVTPYPAGQYQRQSWQAPIEWRGWYVTPYVGATLRYGYLMGMVRAYGRIKAPGGLANGPGGQALVGISVPF